MKQTLFFTFFCWLSVNAYTHPGLIDSNGCHTNYETGDYHCLITQQSCDLQKEELLTHLFELQEKVSQLESELESLKATKNKLGQTIIPLQIPHWCPKATTKVEKMICNNQNVASMDYKMNEFWYAQSKTWREKNKGIQKTFLKQRNICENVDCLERIYYYRLLELGIDAD